MFSSSLCDTDTSHDQTLCLLKAPLCRHAPFQRITVILFLENSLHHTAINILVDVTVANPF
ncbi:hypothetical protein PS631_03582 [Pseudomonas fluorescens]|uniref:Uncharacterized protein n=1 Tax=Pseudomonas fluorescens TaxID=294 RepID=A0A5E6UJP9_PSEFL|nr:hypothetical protein PS631_03582 [Pseudomonas fluorescens]